MTIMTMFTQLLQISWSPHQLSTLLNSTVSASPVRAFLIGASTKGVAFHDSLILVVYMFADGIAIVLVPQCLSHVLTHEEGLTLLVGHCPDLSEQLMMENLNVCIHIALCQRR